MPEDPIVRDLVSFIRKQQLSRRQILQGIAVAGGTLALAACGGDTGSGAKPGASGSAAGSAGSISWGNWPYYLDVDEAGTTFPTLDAFTARTGIKVDYHETLDDNSTFFGTIKDQLELGQFTGYDTVTFTDWMNARLINAGFVQQFDYANLPTVKANMVDSEWNALDVDPGRKFTIPWQLPASGWVWNTEAVPNGIKELNDFLRPELKGKVIVLSEMRDTMGMIMGGLGTDPSGNWGDKEFDAALQWLDDALQSGQIGNVKGNSYDEDLIRGSALAAMAWTGDVIMMNYENGDQWTLEVPESGGLIAADSFTVPNGTPAESKANVEKLIDSYYDPEVAAQVADYVTFITPVAGAQEAMASLNPENAENPLIFPDDAMWARLKHFRSLSAAEDEKYTALFQGVLGL